MIRRRRLIITPGPGRTLPDPEDPSLPQVSPHQPESEPPVPPVEPSQDDRPGKPLRPGRSGDHDEPDEPRDARHARPASAPGNEPWLRGLGVVADEDARRAWLEPHLWAALRARVDATAAERRARWIQPGMR